MAPARHQRAMSAPAEVEPVGEPAGGPTLEVIGREPAERGPMGVLVVAAVLLLAAVGFLLRDRHAAPDFAARAPVPAPAPAPAQAAPAAPPPAPAGGAAPAAARLSGPRQAQPSAVSSGAVAVLIGARHGRLSRLDRAATDPGPAVSGLVLPDPTGGSLSWVGGGRLRSVPAGLGQPAADEGAALRLVGADPAGTVGVQLDAATVRLEPAAGIPGWSVAVPSGWRPAGVLDAGRLLLTRPDGGGAQRIGVADRDGLTELPDPGRLLGAGGDRFLVLPALSPAWHPALWIYRVQAGGHLDVQVVWPPTGWHFVPGPVAVAAGHAVLPVRADGHRRTALAWLGPLEQAAQLVPGSAGAEPARGLLASSAGSVVFAASGPGGVRLAVWHPAVTGRATWVSGVLPTGFRLVCACHD